MYFRKKTNNLKPVPAGELCGWYATWPGPPGPDGPFTMASTASRYSDCLFGPTPLSEGAHFGHQAGSADASRRCHCRVLIHGFPFSPPPPWQPSWKIFLDFLWSTEDTEVSDKYVLDFLSFLFHEGGRSLSHMLGCIMTLVDPFHFGCVLPLTPRAVEQRKDGLCLRCPPPRASCPFLVSTGGTPSVTVGGMCIFPVSS